MPLRCTRRILFDVVDPDGTDIRAEVVSSAPTTTSPLAAEAVTASDSSWKTQRRRSNTTRPSAGTTTPWKAGGELSPRPFETLRFTTAGVASGS